MKRIVYVDYTMRTGTDESQPSKDDLGDWLTEIAEGSDDRLDAVEAVRKLRERE